MLGGKFSHCGDKTIWKILGKKFIIKLGKKSKNLENLAKFSKSQIWGKGFFFKNWTPTWERKRGESYPNV